MSTSKTMTLSHAADKLAYYVYALVDPRDNGLFYVGKGKLNRVFQHELALDDNADVEILSKKEKRITDIQLSGHEVRKVIVRHGLTEATAFEVEAALIDVLSSEQCRQSKLTNIQRGHNSVKQGMMTIAEIKAFYDATPIRQDEFIHNALIVNINKTYVSGAASGDIYKATRGNWVLDSKKIASVEIVLAKYHGVLRAVFKPMQWHTIIEDRPKGPSKRHYFDGVNVSDEPQYQMYINRSLDNYVKGMANPIQYIWHH